MRYAKIAVLCLLMLLVAIAPSSAVIFYVDGTNGLDSNNGKDWTTAKKTIQAAISAANSDSTSYTDEVWVKGATGSGITYNEHVSMYNGISIYGGFAGTETSRDLRNWSNYKTIISGTGLNSSVISAIGSMGNDTVIDGFTIQGGVGSLSGSNRVGGGIECRPGSMYGASPTIRHNYFSGNSATYGGAIYADGSASPVITDNTFYYNTGTAGVTFYCSYGSPVFSGNVCTGDFASYLCGGLYLLNTSNAVISGNTINYCTTAGISGSSNSNLTITGNTIGGSGEGIDCSGGSAIISSNTLTSNTAGGGIHCSSLSSASIFNNKISGNSGTSYGGGIYCNNSSSTVLAIYNNFITGNTATSKGGGIYLSGGTQSSVTNNTIANNTCSGSCGIYLNNAGTTLTNNIIKGSSVCVAINSGGTTPTVTCNDVWNTTLNGNEYSWTPEPTGSNGNISADPAFVSTSDFHLQSTSSCIDAGSDSAVQTGWLDIDNEPRHYDVDGVGTALVDMGADEYYPNYSTNPIVDRGMPTANLNNVAGAGRINIRWADADPNVFYGDDFTLPKSSGDWVIDKITVWAVPDIPVSPTYALSSYFQGITLYTGTPGGSVSTVSTNASATAYTYSSSGNEQNYQTASGTYNQIWQIDFSGLNWRVAGSLSTAPTYLFGVYAAPQIDRLWFNHATLGSGLDGQVYRFNGSTVSSPQVSGSGWFGGKGSNINVKVYAHPVALGQ